VRCLVLLLVCLVGSCATPETVTIPPLPVGDQPILFVDALKRIRSHADTATEAFYRDEWDAVATTAKRIEETTSFLPKSVQVPPGLVGKLAEPTQHLLNESKLLADAATARDAKKVGESLSRIRFEIRTRQSGKESSSK
jgi:hypothetical protein